MSKEIPAAHYSQLQSKQQLAHLSIETEIGKNLAPGKNLDTTGSVKC